MAKLTPADILSLPEYNKIRAEFRERAIKIKNSRRIHLGPYLTFLFENKDTMHYQVQEMLRAEHITKEEAIEHEVITYNELVPEKHQLTATLLVEFEDPVIRAVKLKELVGLENHLFLTIGDDEQVLASFDERQLAEDKLSSVQYIKFNIGEELTRAILGGSQIGVKSTHGACSYHEILSQDQRNSIVEDLKLSLED
jgi:hypothetical protein